MSFASAAFRLCVGILAIAGTGAFAAAPAPLPAPEGPPVLTITGAIAVGNAAEGAVFDRAMLEAMPSRTISTSTPWTVGVHSFTGVPLKALLLRVGVDPRAGLNLAALNDYEAEMPMSEVHDDMPLVAYMLDGQPMSVRARGPLWVIYAFDADGRWRTEMALARSVWQLNRIRVTP